MGVCSSRSALAFAGVMAAMLVVARAHAAPTDEDRAAARSAATAGATAMNEGRFQEAVDLFSRAESIVHAPPHLLYIARANVKLGRLVRAHEAYLKIVREDLPRGAPKAFHEARAAAVAEMPQLESRIPSVKITLDGASGADVAIEIDGQKMAAAITDVPFPIDPGKHAFHAKTADRESEIVDVDVPEGRRDPVVVALALTISHEPVAIAPPPPSPQPAPAEPVVAPPAEPAPSRGVPGSAIVAFGVGAVGLAGGTIFLLQNRSSQSEANAICAAGCPASRRAEIEDLDGKASSAATLSLIGYGVGVAGIAAGVILWATAPHRSSTRGATTPVVDVSANGTYLGLRGSF